MIIAQKDLQRPCHGDGSASSFDSLSSGYLEDPHDVETTLAMFQMHIALCGVGAAGSAERYSFCSLIHQRTGCDFDVDRFLQGLPNASGIPNSRDLGKTTSQKWPSQLLVQTCIHQFVKTGLYSVFPIANVEVLQTLLNQHILDHKTQRAHIADLACLIAFTALVTELHRLEPAFSDTDPDCYLRAALSLLPRLLMEAANLRTLETFTIIVSFVTTITWNGTYYSPSGHISSAYWSHENGGLLTSSRRPYSL